MRKIDTFYLWSQLQKCVNFWHVNFWVSILPKFFEIFFDSKMVIFKFREHLDTDVYNDFLWQTKISTKMEAPKQIKNQQMTLKHKKYFATFIMGGASYRSFREEHLRIMKKDASRSTYARIKRDSKKILDAETHRKKRVSYNTKNDEEKRKWELHVKEIILNCYKRKYVIKMSHVTVAKILMNESKKFDFPWLRKMEFSNNYVTRFMLENDLLFSSQKSDQSFISKDQMDSHRIVN